MLETDTARWLLVLHTAVAVATVGASTHLVIWMRGYRRGVTARHAAVRKFALMALALFAASFVIGNVVYPTYRTRARYEYLDSAPAVIEDSLDRTERHVRAAEKNLAPVPAVTPGRADHQAQLRAEAAERAARWFDVKEHWAALGFALTGALTLILLVWAPKQDDGSAPLGPLTFLMALGAAGTTWVAAVIGVLTVAWRAV
jgi:hypothetical protein